MNFWIKRIRINDANEMKVIFLIVALACLSCTTNNQIREDCILIEVTKIKASCGTSSVWVGMKFKKMNSDYTFVGLVNCPEMYRVRGYGNDFFSSGKIYKIVAMTSYKLSPDEVVLNEYSNTRLPVCKIDEINRKSQPSN